MAKSLFFKIRNKENKFYASIYIIAKRILNFNLPYVKPLGFLFRTERSLRVGIWRWFLKVFYYIPMFKSFCSKCGSNLNLIDGFPYFSSNIKIFIGNNVTIYGDAGFGGYKVYENPILSIGNNSFIGPGVRIGVGKEVKIGNNCLIAARVFIADHDGHPSDHQKRRENLPVEKENIKPIIIGDDAWIGEGAFICKGVQIGRGAIVAAKAVVTKDVPAFTVVVGNPANIIKVLKQSNL